MSRPATSTAIGRDDIIVGVGSGGAPHVKVFNGADPSVVIDSFLAYGRGSSAA